MLPEDKKVVDALNIIREANIGDTMTVGKHGVHTSAEALGVAMIHAGLLSIDDHGCVWRNKKRHGGRGGAYYISLDKPERAEQKSNNRMVIMAHDPVSGGPVCIHVPRLVWSWFNITLPKDGDVITHKDGCVYNNSKENLITRREAKEMKRRGKPVVIRGKTAISKSMFAEIMDAVDKAPGHEDQNGFTEAMKPVMKEHGISWGDLAGLKMQGYKEIKDEVGFVVIEDEQYEAINGR